MPKTTVPVPDIGDFDEVPVVEVLVAVGDTVAQEDSLVVLESEKATMEVPSPAAGKVLEVLVQVGDRVKEGVPLLTLEVEDAVDSQECGAAARPGVRRGSAPTTARPPHAGAPEEVELPTADHSAFLVVLGAGPGGTPRPSGPRISAWTCC